MTDKTALLQPDRGQKATAIHLVSKETLAEWSKRLSAPQRAAIAAQKFEGDGYSYAIIPDGDHWFVVSGVANPDDLSSWCMAKLAEVLPAGTYRRDSGDPGKAAFGWITGQYRFDRYRSDAPDDAPRILLTKAVKHIDPILAEAAATELVRDLVNTPAEDMGPADLEAVAARLAKTYRAELHVTKGDALEREFPMVHMVGRAASRSHAPRMIELEWGDAKHPRVALIGKGVCFDSGGLDIKPSSGMLLMKKDMGGAAHVLALAGLVMQAGLKVRLHVLVPAVENAIAGNAFRPGDVLRSRAGISVEIGNTDAEGRLVLGDALAFACEEEADAVISMATLTGAARVAVGPDLAPYYTDDAGMAAALEAGAIAGFDPVWRLPLHAPYEAIIEPGIADLDNAPGWGFAGSVTAALFLRRFVSNPRYMHFDIYGHVPADQPARPKGGAGQGARAILGGLTAMLRL